MSKRPRELIRKQKELLNWQGITSFKRRLDELLPESLREMWSSRHHDTRDAWTACQFAQHARATSLRMFEQSKHGPDFEVRFRNGARLRVQTTEALLPGRQPRGDFYRDWESKNWEQIHCDGLQRDDNPLLVLEGLRSVVRKKSEMSYDPAMALLVYLNAGGFWINEQEVQQGMADACQEARQKFKTVWVFWGKRLYRCWPEPFSGRPGTFRPKLHDLGWARRRFRDKKEFYELVSR